jgi:hypothetical protein
VITIKKKGSKRIIAQFKGHSGPGCGPRRKPTPPPKRFRDEFARQARACKGRKRGAFITCMKRLEF